MLRVATEDGYKSSHEEMIKRQEKVCQDLKNQEGKLRRTLRDAVVDDVAKLFPCVSFRDSLNTACSDDFSK
jgi:hypothetical protein